MLWIMWTVGWDLHECGCRASLECLIMLRFGNFEIFELFIALNSFFPGQFLGRGWRIVLLWQWHYDGDVEVEN